MRKLPVHRHVVVQPSDQSYRLIPLTKGQNAMVDADDFERLNKFNWYAREYKNTFYATRQIWGTPRKNIHMHREVLNVSEGDVDHINHDGLDNRKINLRPCSRSQNLANSTRRKSKSGFRGVEQKYHRWRSAIRISGKNRFLGSFRTPEEAARAYDKAAKEAFGEFAHLNFITTRQY